MEEVIERANDSEYSLAAAVYTRPRTIIVPQALSKLGMSGSTATISLDHSWCLRNTGIQALAENWMGLEMH